MNDQKTQNHAFARSLSNAGLGIEPGIKCFANMDFGFGDTGSWLEIIKYTNEIFFCRDSDGVHAWHCSRLPIDDRRILEIRELMPNVKVRGCALLRSPSRLMGWVALRPLLLHGLQYCGKL